MITICSSLILFAQNIAPILSKDINVIKDLTTMIKIISIVIFFNSYQVILTILTRALYDLIIPSIIIFVCFTIFIPLICYTYILNENVINILYILLTANASATVLLGYRCYNAINNYNKIRD